MPPRKKLIITREELIALPILVMGIFCLSRGSFGLIIPHSIWFIALGGMFVMAIFNSLRGRINKTKMTILLFIALLLVFYNNWDFKMGVFADAYYYCIIIILAIVSQKYSKWHKSLLSLIIILGIFYAAWTYACGINENIYYNIALPFLRSIDKTAPRGNSTFGITTHYSTNGMYLALALIVTLSINLVQKKTDKYRVLFLLLSVFLMGGVLLSGKRGIVIVAILAFSLTYVLRSRNLGKSAKLLIVLSSALLIAYIASFWLPALRIIVERFETQIELGNVASDRFDLWNEGFRGFLNSPAIGNGWDWFRYHNSFGVIYHVHNCYIQWICELGMLLSLPLYIMVFFSFYRVYKLYRIVITDRKTALSANLLVNAVITFSFMYEIYFLIFMFEGTGYYEIQSSFVYFMCISMVEYYHRILKTLSI